MKVLCSTIPALGHFHPMLPMVNALAKAGHEILFAAPLSFQPAVKAQGFEVFTAGMDMDALVEAADKPQEDGQQLRKDQKAYLMFTQIAPRALVNPLLEIAKDWQPDLLLHDEGEYAAPLVAHLLGLPNVSIGWPSPMRADFQLARVESAVAEIWKEMDLTPFANAGVFRTLFLDACPPSFQSAYGLSLQTRQPIRPAIPAKTAKPAKPDWLKAMPDAPVVHITFGTVATYNDASSIYTDIIEGLADENLNLVLTIGESVEPDALVADKDNVHIARYMPHETLLPHCDVVICHGGCGTTISALAHGLPLLVIPQGGAVQLRNAQACERTGAGLMLPTDQVSAQTVKDKVLRLFNEPGFKQTAMEMAQEIEQLPSAQTLVADIEKMVAEQSPELWDSRQVQPVQ